MRTIALGVAVILFTASGFCEPGATETVGVDGPSLDVAWRADSIERLIVHPEEVLADVDTFWKTDDAFQLATRWHTNNRVPADLELFRDQLTRAANVPAESRASDPSLVLAESLVAEQQSFTDIAIPRLLAFLPDNDLQMATIIHLTAFSKAYAFMTNTQIVIDVTSPKLGGTRASIMNILYHEVYHIGYGINRLLRTEEPLADDRKYFVLDVLHNEGLATYVAWTALDLYPYTDFDDYRMLDDEQMVSDKIRTVNAIFTQIDELSGDEFSTLSWNEGVVGRAYYVAGAHMARKIDVTLGRDALVGTIEQGPRAFVALYNTIAADGQEILEFPAPTERSVSTRMYEHLLANPEGDLDPFSDELDGLVDKDERSVANAMNRLVYKLLYRGHSSQAAVVGRKALELFPGDADLYDTVAEVAMRSGDRDRAIELYRRSLDLDPTNTNAEKYLAELGAEPAG
jgi:hypothetical protein